MKRFTLFTFLYLALGVCLTAIARSLTLVGNWIQYCLDALGGSESELGNGSHFTSVFAANRCLTICRNHCDDMASEF